MMLCNAEIMGETWKVLDLVWCVVSIRYTVRRCEQKKEKKEFGRERKRQL